MNDHKALYWELRFEVAGSTLSHIPVIFKTKFEKKINKATIVRVIEKCKENN